MGTKKARKLIMRDEDTGLLIGPNCELLIRNDKEAQKAVEAAGRLVEQIDKLRRESGLVEKEAAYEALRAALKGWQDYNTEKQDRDDVRSGSWKSLLIRPTKRFFWLSHSEKLPELPPESQAEIKSGAIIPISQIVVEKFGNSGVSAIMERITKRVLDPEGLDQVVKEGLLSADDIEPALIEYPSTPYVKISEVK